MRYSFRLAEVVGHMPDPRKRPGTIKNICEFTGLDRHQVAALLRSEHGMCASQTSRVVECARVAST
jgi:hypothetical protein